MAGNAITDDLLHELENAAQRQGCEVAHVSFRGSVLQIVLDRPDGVSLADCESFSKQVSPLLDVEGFGNGGYTLEVSSPGLDRQLYRPRDYERFVGRRVKVTFFRQPDRSKSTIRGSLRAYEQGAGGTAVVADEATGEDLRIPLSDIKIARLEIEL